MSHLSGLGEGDNSKIKVIKKKYNEKMDNWMWTFKYFFIALT